MLIDPPITFCPTSIGRDPEPLGSDRFATMMSRAAEAAAPARRSRRFEHRARPAGNDLRQPASRRAQ